MKEYLYAWILVAVLAVLAEWMLPRGIQAKMTGSFRFLAGLCLLVAFLPVAKEGIERIQSFGESDVYAEWEAEVGSAAEPYFQAYLSDVTAESCQTWVLETLASRFGVSASQCEVAVTVTVGTNDVPAISEVQICLYGQEIFKNPHEIEAYIEEKLATTCLVSVGMRRT